MLVIVLQALGMSTSRIALRVTFFRFDLEPSVATSLRTDERNVNGFVGDTYQMVATPYWRLVRTAQDQLRTWPENVVGVRLTVVAVEHFGHK